MLNLIPLCVPRYAPIEHDTDIYSPEVLKIMRQLDTVVETLFKRIADEQLMKDMNVIITADHGHTNVYTPYTHTLVTV
jgi:predicted AlkP superfamily pyrophosphatase or phosphodiesterase